MRLYISFDQCFLHDFMIVIFIELSISCSIFSPIFEAGLEILGLTPSVFYSLRVAAHRLRNFLLMVAMHDYYYCMLTGVSLL